MAAAIKGFLRCSTCAAKGNTSHLNCIVSATRQFSYSFPVFAGGAFRRKQGKAVDSVAYGPLTDTPDWTYLDGSLPPLSKRELERQKKRIETALLEHQKHGVACKKGWYFAPIFD